jgi:hypothetical protein
MTQVSADSNCIQAYTVDPEGQMSTSARRRAIIERQIQNLCGMQNEMTRMFHLMNEMRESFVELAAEDGS